MRTATALLVCTGLLLVYLVYDREPPTYAAPSSHERADPLPFALVDAPPAGHVVRRFEVEGMCCEGCGAKLQQALRDVPGVGDMAVDRVLGRVEVVVPLASDVAALERALNFDKYSARFVAQPVVAQPVVAQPIVAQPIVAQPE